MSHIAIGKNKLLLRINRIQGQINAIKKTLVHEHEHEHEHEHGHEIDDCSKLLQLIAACRGAINGLMLEVIDGHIRHHICDPDKISSKQAQATQELLEVVKSYFK